MVRAGGWFPRSLGFTWENVDDGEDDARCVSVCLGIDVSGSVKGLKLMKPQSIMHKAMKVYNLCVVTCLTELPKIPDLILDSVPEELPMFIFSSKNTEVAKEPKQTTFQNG